MLCPSSNVISLDMPMVQDRAECPSCCADVIHSRVFPAISDGDGMTYRSIFTAVCSLICTNYDNIYCFNSMEVDNTQVPASDIPKQQQPSPSAVAEATVLPPQEPGEQRRTSSSDVHAQPTIGATKKGEEEAPPSADQQDTAMLTEELPDGSIKASKEPTSTPRVSQISEAELETLYASLESCKKQLMQARQNERRNAGLANSLASMEREGDRYRSVSDGFPKTRCKG